jgi:FkbM family methyltransferase
MKYEMNSAGHRTPTMAAVLLLQLIAMLFVRGTHVTSHNHSHGHEHHQMHHHRKPHYFPFNLTEEDLIQMPIDQFVPSTPSHLVLSGVNVSFTYPTRCHDELAPLLGGGSVVNNTGVVSAPEYWFLKEAYYDPYLAQFLPGTYRYLRAAQLGEDVWMWEHWFFAMRAGLIVESGAFDGKVYSSTYMLEKMANWSAIHIEADPENFQLLVKKRGGSININAALCNSSTTKLHYTQSGKGAVRGFVEFMSEPFLELWHKDLYLNKSLVNTLPVVPCVTISSILNALSVTHVDVWVLDTEGSELSVLEGTDFNAVFFRSVVIECPDKEVEKNKLKMDVMHAKNFTCLFKVFNCFCKHNLYNASVTKHQFTS